MGLKSKTKNQKKSRASAVHLAQEEFTTVPHSFVFHRGQIGKNVHELILNMRRVMEPFTATSLKVRKKNALKDFVSVAGPLGVTHFLVFSKTATGINFKVARLPRGPTLTFRVNQYSLVKDVVSSLKRHRMHDQQFTHPPLLILNNFGLQGMHVKLMATVFQHMFPSINVHKVNLNTIKRCILMNFDPDNQLIEFRHYSLKVVPVGMSKGMKKLIQERFPNMSKWEDISELLVKGANLSESEAEQDGEHNITELPQLYAGRGNMKAQQSAVRLTEIGPRMTLQLVKIEEGLSNGNVLYHSFIEKTVEEIQATLASKEKKLKLKAQRRQKQEQDIQLKKDQREEHKKKSLKGIKRKQQQVTDGDSDAEDPGIADVEKDAEEDDDFEYYRQEVGQDPDEDLQLKGGKRKGPRDRSPHSSKKFKTGKTPEGTSDSKVGVRGQMRNVNHQAKSTGRKFKNKKGAVGTFRKNLQTPGRKYSEKPKSPSSKFHKNSEKPKSPSSKFHKKSAAAKFGEQRRFAGGKFNQQQRASGKKSSNQQNSPIGQPRSPAWKNRKAQKSQNGRKQEPQRSPGNKFKFQHRPEDDKRNTKFNKNRVPVSSSKSQGHKMKPGFRRTQGGKSGAKRRKKANC